MLLQVTLLLLVRSFATVSCHGLNGVHLKFAAFHTPPFDVLTREPDGNYTLTGSSMKVFSWIAKRVNFTFSVVPVEAELIAKYGSTEAAFYKIINKEVDGIVSGFVLSPDRAARMDYTSASVGSQAFSLIAPAPGEESRLFAFILPFQPMVWATFGAIIVLLILMMSTFSLMYFYKFKSATERAKECEIHRGPNVPAQLCFIQRAMADIGYYSIYMMNVIASQGIFLSNIQHSFRILNGLWLLAAVVLVNSYSSTVVSFLTLPKMKPAINTFADVAASKDVGLLLREDHVLGQDILSATTGLYKVLGDKTRRHPERMLSDSATIMKMLDTGRYAYPYLTTFGQFYVADRYKKEGKCRFHLSRLSISSGSISLFLQKGSPYTSSISFGVNELVETGLLNSWIKELAPKAGKCLSTKRDKNIQQVGIKLEDLSSAFFILGVGSSLALLTFLAELVVVSIHKKKNRSYRVNVF